MTPVVTGEPAATTYEIGLVGPAPAQSERWLTIVGAGSVTFSALPIGNYTVVERDPGTGYTVTITPKTVVVTNGGVATATVTNAYVEQASFADGVWTARDGWTQSLDDRPSLESDTNLAGQRVDIVHPSRFSSDEADVAMMTFGELRAHIAQLAESGFSVADERVLLQSRVAYPAVVLVMTVLGIPFGLISGRYGALYGVGLAIGIACLQLLLTFFFNSTGSAGVLPAPVAAWATNVLFLAAAGYLLLTVRT